MRKIFEPIYNSSRRIPKSINNYIKDLTENQKKQIKEKIDSINSKYNSIVFLKKPKCSYKHIDPMFFSFENLPPFGKEYWFMKFVPEQKNTNEKRQLLAMFGRSTENIKINKKHVKTKNISGKHSGFMNSWFFDKKKNLVVDNKCSISILPDKITAEEKDTVIEFTGKYPKYNLKILKTGKKGKNNKTICNLEINKPKDSKTPYKFRSFFKLFAGFALINIYFDFSGELHEKPFKGKCYIQKVILIGPFIPWYWGRIVFANGSVLKYYMPKIEVFGISYKLLSDLVFYNSEEQKLYEFEGLKIKKIGKDKPLFIITDSKNKFHAIIETYSSQEFLFVKTSKFRYTEYLAKVKKICINNHEITDKFGGGIGLVEEARGYVP